MTIIHLNTAYRISEDAIHLIENALDNPNLVQVSVASDCVIVVRPATQDYDAGGIERLPNGESPKWKVSGVNTRLNNADFHYIYIRLERETNAALLVFDTKNRNIDGSLVVEEPVPGEESTVTIASTPDPFYYYMKVGEITATDSVNSATVKRSITFDYGYFQTDGFTDDTISDLLDRLKLKLDQVVWDRNWVEKKDPNGIEYIFTTKPIVTAAGVTMYSGDTPYLPSMFEGIPLDSETLAWVNGKITVVGGTGQGGITGINVTGTGNAVTGASLSADGLTITLTKGSEFALKSDIPSLSGYATQSWVNTQLGSYATTLSLKTVSDKLNNFLEGTDTDGIINKWKELENFLAGQTQTSTLAQLLSGKADKATTLAGYGITDAYTKNEINTTLGNYVTKSGDQDITGVKSFINGLKVGDILVKKHADGVVEIDGDLVVTGGVTMYGIGSHSASTILDALPIDADTLSKEGGVLSVIGGVGGGSVDGIILNGTTYSPNESTKLITLPNYPTSLPASDVYAWAKASVKPSYTFNELTVHPTTLAGYGITDAPTKTGSGASGTWGINITGQATNATKWATSRNFNIADNNSYYTGTSTAVNGTANVILRLPETIYATSFTANNRRFNECLAVYDSTTLTVAGTICITLPNGFNSSMNIYEIYIYEYNSNTASVITIGAYNYGEGKCWVQMGYHTKGAFSKKVRLGYTGSKCVILLGETTTQWNYPKVYLKSVFTGFTNYYKWVTGYSISLLTSESGYSAVITPPRATEYFGDVHSSGFKRNNSNDSYVLLGGGGHKALSTITSEYDARYLTALGTNNNYLTWTKNGTVNNITVPYATLSSNLEGRYNKPVTTVGGSGKLIYLYKITSSYSGLFPTSDNSNALLTINRQEGNYDSQLGFSSNGNLYYRFFSNEAINTTKAWKLILDNDNYSDILDVRYYTKNEINTVLGDYVTKAGSQDITGIKSFVNGLKVGDILVKKHADGVVEIDGDLVVTGGVTMYGIGNHTASTILDALPIDSATLSKVGGKLSVIGGTGASTGSITLNGHIYEPDSEGNITLPSYPTTLPASDVYAWAKSSVKPSYTFNELTVHPTTLAGYGITDGVNVVSVSGSGNAVTSASISGHTLSLTKGNTFWDAGNDGAGSGLDADLLDGVQYQNILERGSSSSQKQTKAAAWYRVGEFLGSNSDSPQAIIMIRRNYVSPANEGYTFSISLGYNGAISLTQLTGNTGGHLIKQVRIDYTNSGKAYFDVYCGYANYINDIYVTSIGAFKTYNSNSFVVNPTTGSSTATYDTYNGMACNYGFAGNVAGNASSATKLQTARSINGTNFDGTANITTANWGYTRTLSLSGNASGSVSINGGSNVMLSVTNNYASVAGKLQTARNIWGQPFNGEGNVSGAMSGVTNINSAIYILNGYVGINTPAADYRVKINGDIYTSEWVRTVKGLIFQTTNSSRVALTDGRYLSLTSSNNIICIDGSNNNDIYVNYVKGSTGYAPKTWYWKNGSSTGWADFNIGNLNVNGNILATGGVTMYSDLRKKNVIKEILLPLESMAKADLFDYIFKSDEKGIVRAGTSAQYWNKYLPEVVSKDNEDFFTMDYGVLATVCSLSLAKHFHDFLNNEFHTHETEINKLKKENEKMKKRIEELERSRA